MNFVGLKVSEPRRLGTFESCFFFLLSGNVVLICLVVVLFVCGGVGSMHMRCVFCAVCAKEGTGFGNQELILVFLSSCVFVCLLLQSLGAMNGETVNR